MSETRFTLTPDQALFLIRKRKAIAIALVLPGDGLSLRMIEALDLIEPPLEAKGFSLACVEYTPKVSSMEDLSSVRFPQLRFFSDGKLVKKLVGLTSPEELIECLRQMSDMI